MDENTLNPTPDEQAQAETENSEIEIVSAEEAQNEEVQLDEVQAEEAQADGTLAALVQEQREIFDEETEQAEADACFEEEPIGQEEAAPKKKNKGFVAILAALVGLFIVSVVCIAAIFIKSNAAVDFDKIAMNIGGTVTVTGEDADAPEDGINITAGEFAYVYASVNAYAYGQLTDEQLREYAIGQMSSTIGLYNDAVKAGYTLTEEELASIDEAMASLVESAESMSMSGDEYVQETFGKGYKLEYVRSFMEKNILASRYYDDIMDGIEAEFGTDEAVEAFYSENKVSYDLANVSYYCLDANDASAAEKADKIVSAAKGDSFASAVKNVNSSGSVNKLTGTLTKDGVSASINEDAAEWIFETDDSGDYVNKAGAVARFTKNSLIYIIYVNAEPARDNTHAVTLDYIRVDISTDNEALTEDVRKLEATSTMNSILTEFEKTDKSADEFASLVLTHDESDNELVYGDAFEDITTSADVDEAVLDWAFKAQREVGDYAVVEGDGSYYLVFYREQAEDAVWYTEVKNELLTAEATAWEEDAMTKYDASTVLYDSVIDATINTVLAAMNASA